VILAGPGQERLARTASQVRIEPIWGPHTILRDGTPAADLTGRLTLHGVGHSLAQRLV
jgi:hypothetical protein